MSTDSQLLRQFQQDRSESAFAELVAKHIDLVFNAGLRVVGGDRSLAQDVAQVVFTDLARKAAGLPEDIVLAGWLYRHTCYTAAKAVRSERRRKAREQLAVAMTAADEPSEPDLQPLAGHLDAGLQRLRPSDREVLVLRFLKREDLASVGATLGISEDAAQKRVVRAVEKLRTVLRRLGVTTTAAGLTAALTATAATAAPSGLAVSVSAASLAAVAQTGSLAALFQLGIAMKFKLVVTGVLTVASVVAPVLVLREAQTRLQQQEARIRSGSEEIAALQSEISRLSNRTGTAESTTLLPKDLFRELLMLRGEIGRLRREAETDPGTGGQPASGTDLLTQLEQEWTGRAHQLKQWLDQNPAGKIPELALVDESEWVNAVYPMTLDSEEEYRRAMSNVRANAEIRVLGRLSEAWRAFTRAKRGEQPSTLKDLLPYLSTPIDETMLERYTFVRSRELISELQTGEEWVITQKQSVDPAWDTRFAYGLHQGATADCRVTNRWAQVP